jgi:hypothetical protein
MPPSGDGCGVPANFTFKNIIVQTTHPSIKPIVSVIRLCCKLLFEEDPAPPPCRIRAIVDDAILFALHTIYCTFSTTNNIFFFKKYALCFLSSVPMHAMPSLSAPSMVDEVIIGHFHEYQCQWSFDAVASGES